MLQVEVLDQHHDGGVDVLRVLDQPLTVQVAAVVGHQVPRGGDVPPGGVIQNTAAHCVRDNQFQSINVLFKVQSHCRNGLRALLGKDINTLIKPSKWSHNISG